MSEPEEPKITIQQICKMALFAQDAVNLSGLVHSWHGWLPVIRADAEARGISANNHPVNVMMADKIGSLAENSETMPFSKAYEMVTNIANGH